MNTISDKSKGINQPDKFQATPRLQEVMSIAQREQSVALKQFFKSWRQVNRPKYKETTTINIALGTR